MELISHLIYFFSFYLIRQMKNWGESWVLVIKHLFSILRPADNYWQQYSFFVDGSSLFCRTFLDSMEWVWYWAQWRVWLWAHGGISFRSHLKWKDTKIKILKYPDYKQKPRTPSLVCVLYLFNLCFPQAWVCSFQFFGDCLVFCPKCTSQMMLLI